MRKHTSPRAQGALIVGLLLTPLFAATGCNRGPEMTAIEGQVLFDGKPLTFGSVVFQHRQGGQPARAEIQPDGSFVLSTFSAEDGARLGPNRVRVLCYATQDPKVVQSGPRGDALGPSLIPVKYTKAATSGIVIEVEKGMELPVVIELTSGKK